MCKIGSHYVARVGFKLFTTPTSASQVVRLQAFATALIQLPVLAISAQVVEDREEGKISSVIILQYSSRKLLIPTAKFCQNASRKSFV